MIHAINAHAKEQSVRNLLYLHSLTVEKARDKISKRKDWHIQVDDTWILDGEHKSDWDAMFGQIILHWTEKNGWYPNPDGSLTLSKSLRKIIPVIEWTPPTQRDYYEAHDAHPDINSDYMSKLVKDAVACYQEKHIDYIQVKDELFHISTDIANLGTISLLEAGAWMKWRLRVKYKQKIDGVVDFGYFGHLAASRTRDRAVYSKASLFKQSTINKLKRLQYETA